MQQLFIYFSVYKNCKNKLYQKSYNWLSSLTKTFTSSAPRNTPSPHITVFYNWTFKSHQKILFPLRKFTNKCLGKEGTMGCRPFFYIEKYALFHILYRTECSRNNYTTMLSSHKHMKNHSQMVWQYNFTEPTALK